MSTSTAARTAQADKKAAAAVNIALPKLSKPHRRKRSLAALYRESPSVVPEVRTVALAESFDIQAFCKDEKIGQTYQTVFVEDGKRFFSEDALHLTKLKDYRIRPGIQDCFIFSEGVVVSWDMDPAELAFIESRLKQYAYAPYEDTLVQEETETMPYNLVNSGKTAVKRGTIYINTNTEQATEQAVLERFAFSHAIAASVKIGIWEAKMNDYAEPLSDSAEVLSKGKIPWGRRYTLEKIGELAKMRQSVTVNSLLNEDFYWDRQELEKYHVQMKSYFTVQRRINELNSRIGYCEDLVKLIDSINSHRHASRLEWMIIFLIVVEVVFDAFHFLDSKPKPVYIVGPATATEE